ncbi:MAG: creatinine amidohydrolase [Deltaproteobacteria bacterium RIFCSPLOWO2_12_FULL_43_16]|nr:MAG: creatinine amidohydrolase [Deltaproteobacteria bacterium GWA2_43_19]OGQ11341.1 MAG: creatinine amidohydrolase [Deltaproteobacteria bacterium RIFCSPHIGHO2_02_FULL_43_33]OGQ43787.1 MAG: creatinine amidohydrolase [Deltaproteobacteria bacterium RIFCSPLOWO2_01_FULL_42_9]OGQ58975.1 MAG: creatinine amidohydrolase [Deltaproteobacteria bacterium RIFCSPLOWO2_12_FULL_43_16]HBR17303.1 creatininase [Deltaproteobacteria bacterium]
MLLESITMTDFQKGLKKTKTLIIPFGTVEEHGSHLPLSTDTMQVYEVVKEAAKRIKVFVAPPLHYGVLTSTRNHAGSIGISANSLRMITRDIIKSAYVKGLRNFILISGHAGNIHMSALKEIGEEMIDEFDDIKIAVISEYDMIRKESDKFVETKDDGHAGEIETSRILHLAPHLVKGRAKEEYPKLPKPFLVRDKVKYWKGGIWGNPAKATHEKGKKLFLFSVDRVVEIIKRIEKIR